jgi:hypothetical protein
MSEGTFGRAMKKGLTLAGRYPVALRYLSTSQRSANSFNLLSNLLATITCSTNGRVYARHASHAQAQAPHQLLLLLQGVSTGANMRVRCCCGCCLDLC